MDTGPETKDSCRRDRSSARLEYNAEGELDEIYIDAPSLEAQEKLELLALRFFTIAELITLK